MTEHSATETPAPDGAAASPDRQALTPEPWPLTPAPLTPGRWSWIERIWAVLLVLAIFVAYQPAYIASFRPLRCSGFVWDDDAHVPRPDLRSWDGLTKIWFPVHGRTQQYYPLLYTAFWLQYQLWGDHPLGYHLTNILMHAVVALMLAEVLRRLRVPGAFFAAAVFALHPVQVESVAWITEFKNTFSAAFYLATTMAYLDFDQSRRQNAYVRALVLFVLSLLSKTVTATFPAAMLVIFWWKRGQLSWRRDVWPLLPFFAVSAAFGVFVAWWEHSVIGAHGAAFNFSLFQRCLIAGHAVWFYLGKLFWPANLMFFYPQWDLTQHRAVQCLYGVAAIGLLAVLWKLRVRWRAPLAAYLFYVGTLFPLLGFSNAVLFKYTFVADHFQYLASMGLIALACGLITLALSGLRLPGGAEGRSRLPGGTEGRSRLPGGTETQGSDAMPIVASEVPPGRRDLLVPNVASEVPPGRRDLLVPIVASEVPPGRRDLLVPNVASEVPPGRRDLLRRAGYGACIALLAVLATLTYRQSSQYKNLFVLFKETIKRNPGCWLAYNYLGNEFLKMGQIDEAKRLFEATIIVKRDHSGAHHNLGLVWERKGLLKDAEREYREEIKCAPDAPQSYDGLAMLVARQGRVGEALELCRISEKIEPKYARAYNNEGRILQMCGRFEESIRPLETAAELGEGEFVDAECNLAASLEAVGQAKEAEGRYRATIDRHPDSVEAHCGLGRLLQATRRFDAAKSQFSTALRLNDKSADAQIGVAQILGLKSHWKEALAHYRRAAELEPKNIDAIKGVAGILGQCPDRSLRDGAEAVAAARRADDLANHRRPDCLQVLAAAYAEAGQLDEAVAAAKKALNLAAAAKLPALENILREQIRSYENQRPER